MEYKFDPNLARKQEQKVHSMTSCGSQKLFYLSMPGMCMPL